MTSEEIDGEMDELLSRLQILDEETWNSWEAIVFQLFSATKIENSETIAYDILQGCIQRACSTRKWNTYQYNLIWRDCHKECHASISYRKEHAGLSPAEALLKAYVAALESEK